MKIKKLLIISIIATSFLTGCNKNESLTPYEITENSSEPTIETEKKAEKDKQLEKILNKSETTLDESKELNGTDMSELMLINYEESKYVKLNEIIDTKKPTVILLTSPICGACSDINYSEVLALNDSANILIATPEYLSDEEFVEEKGLSADMYYLNSNMIANNFAEDETLKPKYNQMISLGLPSSIYINSDMTFEFAVSGTKYANEILSYIEYLN